MWQYLPLPQEKPSLTELQFDVVRLGWQLWHPFPGFAAFDE